MCALRKFAVNTNSNNILTIIILIYKVRREYEGSAKIMNYKSLTFFCRDKCAPKVGHTLQSRMD